MSGCFSEQAIRVIHRLSLRRFFACLLIAGLPAGFMVPPLAAASCVAPAPSAWTFTHDTVAVTAMAFGARAASGKGAAVSSKGLAAAEGEGAAGEGASGNKPPGEPLNLPQKVGETGTRILSNDPASIQPNISFSSKAIKTAQEIEENGMKAPPGYQPKSEFRNVGPTPLPGTDANGTKITYTEYDVKPLPPAGSNETRGLERVVYGTDGSWYYTNDHYVNWIQIK